MDSKQQDIEMNDMALGNVEIKDKKIANSPKR